MISSVYMLSSDAIILFVYWIVCLSTGLCHLWGVGVCLPPVLLIFRLALCFAYQDAQAQQVRHELT